MTGRAEKRWLLILFCQIAISATLIMSKGFEALHGEVSMYNNVTNILLKGLYLYVLSKSTAHDLSITGKKLCLYFESISQFIKMLSHLKLNFIKSESESALIFSYQNENSTISKM